MMSGRTFRERDRETERPRDRETERPRDRETERPRDRETERQREMSDTKTSPKNTKIPIPQRTTHPGSSKEIVVFFSIVGRSPLEKDRLTAQSAHPQPNYLSN
jgi:hypothetical protein